MALSSPTKRNLIHTRDIKCLGYERDDGLWDIEGRITDIKSYSFTNMDRGEVNAGTPVHDMTVRLTINTDLVIVDTEAFMEFTPFAICPAISESIKKLIGVQIKSGWTRAVNNAIGGVKGCTHINQLLIGPLATTAYQSIVPRKAHKITLNKQSPEIPPGEKPDVLDTCHAFDTSGDNVKRLWPKFYQSK